MSSGHGQQPLRTVQTDSQDSPWSLEAEGDSWEAATEQAWLGWMGRGAGGGQGSLLAPGLFITWALLPRRVAEWLLAVCHSGASPVSPQGMGGEGLRALL